MKTKILATSLTALQILPLLVLAQVTPLPESPVRSFEDFLSILRYVVNFVFTLLMILAIIFILIAAFNYLTAMGNPEKVKAAQSMLIYAAVAIAIALIAQGVQFMVSQLLARRA
jgi:hypothetical protein